MTRRYSETESAFEGTDSGSILTQNHATFEFIPESDTVNASGVSQLLSLACKIAGELGKPRKMINAGRIENHWDAATGPKSHLWPRRPRVSWAKKAE